MPTTLPGAMGQQLAWLLRLTIGGSDFYLSTSPIVITRDDGSIVSHTGGLTEPDYSESLSRFSHTVDDMATSLEVVVDGLNISTHRRKGFQLQRATGELSCVTIINGVVQQTYEGRLVHVVGRVSEPTYGHPDAPVGYFTFTLDGRPGADSEPFHSSTMFIDGGRITTVVTDDDHEGKAYPLVFGQPGTYVNALGVSRKTSASPAYIIDKDTNTPPRVDTVLVAGHHVAAATVTIFAGDPVTSYNHNITNTVDNLGQPIATADLTSDNGGSSMTGLGTAGSNWRLDNTEFWVCWDGGAGVQNPLSGTSVSGAGDLLIWALSQTPYDVDYGAWEAVKGYLNQYEFSGYLNDPGVTIWEWITTIAELIVPLTIRTGAEGIYPIIQDIHISKAEAETVLVGPDFYRSGPIQVHGTPDEIRNTITLEWCLRAKTGDFKQHTTIGVFDPDDVNTMSTIYSTTSISRFGTKAETVETPWVYTRTTAEKILADMVRLKGSLGESVGYFAGLEHSHLMLGDVIKVTDLDIGFSDQLMTVMGKAWAGTGWNLELLIEDDPVRDDRPI